jgi:GT2 family glycosyltransferase
MPKTSVIIVTYNSEDTIGECLASLDAQDYLDFEVILVDNASSDRTRAIVSSYKPRFPLKTVFLDKNSGFTGANNIGLSCSKGELIALLNPDAKAEPGWLKALSDGIARRSDVGICTSKILTWDSKTIDSAGDMMLTSLRAFKRGEGRGSDGYDKECMVFAACGAGAMYKRRMLDEIGFFDEDFFIQCEDTDLSFRAQLAGWKVLYAPEARVLHKVGHSIGRASERNVYYTQRNIEFVRIKNVPLWMLMLYLPQMTLNLIVDFLYFGVRHLRFKAFIKAKLDALSMLPLMLKKRRAIMSRIKRADDSYIRSLMTPIASGENRSLFAEKIKKFFP